MIYTTITVHDEPDYYPCDECFDETHYSELFESTNGNMLCPDCFDKREEEENE